MGGNLIVMVLVLSLLQISKTDMSDKRRWMIRQFVLATEMAI